MGLPSEDPDHIWDAHIANPSHVVDLNGQTLGSFDTCIHNYIVHHVMCELIVFFACVGEWLQQDLEVKYYVRREEVDQTTYRVHETDRNPESPARSEVLDRFGQFAGPPVEEGIILDQRPPEERARTYRRDNTAASSRSRSPLRGPAIEDVD